MTGVDSALHASPIFRVTPYIVFGAMCCAAAIIPSLATDLPFGSAADTIALVGFAIDGGVYAVLLNLGLLNTVAGLIVADSTIAVPRSQSPA